MRLSKPVALLVLLATLVPACYVAWFFASAFVGIANETTPTGSNVTFVALHLANIIWIWALMAVYIALVFKSKAVPQDQKTFWAVALLFFHLFAMLPFWWLYIWPRAVETDQSPVVE